MRSISLRGRPLRNSLVDRSSGMPKWYRFEKLLTPLREAGRVGLGMRITDHGSGLRAHRIQVRESISRARQAPFDIGVPFPCPEGPAE